MDLIAELEALIQAAEQNPLLRVEKNFELRSEALDLLSFPVIDHLQEMLTNSIQSTPLISLKFRAEKIKSDLEAIDRNLFEKLREKIRKGLDGKGFKKLAAQYLDTAYYISQHPDDPGYDNLDSFITALFSDQEMPEPTKSLEPDMVSYQKTPSRIVFELVERYHFSEKDVFFDIGSGLGHTAILIHLLAEIRTVGIEFEPAFCDYARACAHDLLLSNASFVNADARNADYSEGTVFFMFTPFRREILHDVLELLKRESSLRNISIITYGACAAELALQSWLHQADPIDNHTYSLNIFRSSGNSLF